MTTDIFLAIPVTDSTQVLHGHQIDRVTILVSSTSDVTIVILANASIQ